MRFYISLLLLLIFSQHVHSQLTVSGTIYDISKINYVEDVRIVSSSGMFTISDSLGRYSLRVMPEDSITFYYNDKPTQKFAVASITHPEQFDISIRLSVKSKYSVLKEVKVYSRTYKQDSIQNRENYADVFEFRKPAIRSSITPGGAVGADLTELINIFRFRRNKNIRAFQQRLEEQEREKYIDYRFNKTFVRRITNLEPPLLDSFIKWYRPSYEFASMSDELSFNQYILNCSYQFRKLMTSVPGRKPEELINP